MYAFAAIIFIYFIYLLVATANYINETIAIGQISVSDDLSAIVNHYVDRCAPFLIYSVAFAAIGFMGGLMVSLLKRNSDEANNGNEGIEGEIASLDTPSPGFAVLGFFVPVVGLILFLVWKDNMPQKAKSCGKGALAGVIVAAAISIFTLLVLPLLL